MAVQAAAGERADMYLAISRKLVDTLPEDPYEAVLAIIAEFRHAMSLVPESPGNPASGDRIRYQIAQEVCALLSVYLQREGFALTPPHLADWHKQSAEERSEAVARVIQFLNELRSDITVQQHLERSEYLEHTFEAALGPALRTGFSEEDLGHIRDLLASVRELVRASRDLAPAHQRHLLQRLDRLVGEFRQKTYDLSLFWGFVVEMSLVFRPPSEEAALLAPLMEKLIDLVWSAQAKAFDLPAGGPFKLFGQRP